MGVVACMGDGLSGKRAAIWSAINGNVADFVQGKRGACSAYSKGLIAKGVGGYPARGQQSVPCAFVEAGTLPVGDKLFGVYGGCFDSRASATSFPVRAPAGDGYVDIGWGMTWSTTGIMAMLEGDDDRHTGARWSVTLPGCPHSGATYHLVGARRICVRKDFAVERASMKSGAPWLRPLACTGNIAMGGDDYRPRSASGPADESGRSKPSQVNPFSDRSRPDRIPLR